MRHDTEDRRKARVWNIRDSGKPTDALYIGRPGKGQSGTWGKPSRLTGHCRQIW